jgi:hypothetical protein
MPPLCATFCFLAARGGDDRTGMREMATASRSACKYRVMSIAAGETKNNSASLNDPKHFLMKYKTKSGQFRSN